MPTPQWVVPALATLGVIWLCTAGILLRYRDKYLSEKRIAKEWETKAQWWFDQSNKWEGLVAKYTQMLDTHNAELAKISGSSVDKLMGET